MSRTIDARLGRMERALGIDPSDEFAWLGRLSDDDLERLIHDVRSCIAANEGGLFTADQVSDARTKKRGCA